jgi:hypothetical protein
MTGATNQQSAAGIWAREGGSEITDLIGLLAEASGIHDFSGSGPDIQETAELALKMQQPIRDWERPAREAGWVLDNSSLTPGACYKRDHGETHEAANWVEACKLERVQPDRLPIRGQWIVSEWLAGQLADRGERVTRNFTGLSIWSRTSRGPDVSQDPVLQRIASETASVAPSSNEDDPSP